MVDAPRGPRHRRCVRASGALLMPATGAMEVPDDLSKFSMACAERANDTRDLIDDRPTLVLCWHDTGTTLVLKHWSYTAAAQVLHK